MGNLIHIYDAFNAGIVFGTEHYNVGLEVKGVPGMWLTIGSHAWYWTW